MRSKEENQIFHAMGTRGIGSVSAVGSGANSAIQVIGERRVMLTDAHERLSDSPRDAYASALGGSSNPSFTSAETDRPGELLNQEVSLRHRLFDSFRVAHFPSVFNVFVISRSLRRYESLASASRTGPASPSNRNPCSAGSLVAWPEGAVAKLDGMKLLTGAGQ